MGSRKSARIGSKRSAPEGDGNLEEKDEDEEEEETEEAPKEETLKEKSSKKKAKTATK